MRVSSRVNDSCDVVGIAILTRRIKTTYQYLNTAYIKPVPFVQVKVIDKRPEIWSVCMRPSYLISKRAKLSPTPLPACTHTHKCACAIFESLKVFLGVRVRLNGSQHSLVSAWPKFDKQMDATARVVRQTSQPNKQYVYS